MHTWVGQDYELALFLPLEIRDAHSGYGARSFQSVMVYFGIPWNQGCVFRVTLNCEPSLSPKP